MLVWVLRSSRNNCLDDVCVCVVGGGVISLCGDGDVVDKTWK